MTAFFWSIPTDDESSSDRDSAVSNHERDGEDLYVLWSREVEGQVLTTLVDREGT